MLFESLIIIIIITHTDSSHMIIAIICLCDSVCLFVCTKMAETKNG